MFDLICAVVMFPSRLASDVNYYMVTSGSLDTDLANPFERLWRVDSTAVLLILNALYAIRQPYIKILIILYKVELYGGMMSGQLI